MNTYTFVSRVDFEEGIRQNKFLEFGEKDGNLYGTSVDSVRTVIRYVCIFLLATHFIQKNMSTFFSVETSLSTHVAYVLCDHSLFCFFSWWNYFFLPGCFADKERCALWIATQPFSRSCITHPSLCLTSSF